jgi:hypothetical protein
VKEIDLKIYLSLLSEALQLSKLPKSVLHSQNFKNLLTTNVLEKISVGKGSVITVRKSEILKGFINTHFPDYEIETDSKSANVAKFRDSKATQIINEPIFFLRGFINVQVNGEKVDLNAFTQKFGLFTVKNPVIETSKICFVENLESFLKAEELLGRSYIFLHKYGRIGSSSISGIKATEILVFSDYDYTGLNEYLNIKRIFEDAIFYMPENFDEIFNKYSKLSPKNIMIPEKVSKSNDSVVKAVREKSISTNRFLEQEILFHL